MKIILNDIAVNFTERGMPQGLPVVFIHGFPFSYEMWGPQIYVLPNNIHVIAYDVRGHGSSDVGDRPLSIDIFVDDLIALLDHLFIEQAILCGLSMGGYIALRTVERYAHRVRGLILCDTKSTPDTEAAKLKRAHTIKALKANGVQPFAENFVKTVFCESTFETNPGVIAFIKQIICTNSPRGIRGTLQALASRTDTTPVLSSLRIPTCILVGEHDKLTPPSDARSMHRIIAGSELHVLTGAAHMSNLENTQAFNTRITDFLKKLL